MLEPAHARRKLQGIIRHRRDDPFENGFWHVFETQGVGRKYAARTPE